MPSSSIASRYLQTLENNALENKPKSPPKSIKSPSRIPDLSPTKISGPLRSTGSTKDMETSPARSTRKNFDRSSIKAASSPLKMSSLRDSVPRVEAKTDRRALDLSTMASTKAGSSANVVIRGLQPASTIGPKPDRNPLMHNQDLNPSEVKWDKERKNWQTYEYLCHVVEAKEWMEKLLGENLPPAEEFPTSLQNGISLAKVVQRLRPDLMKWPIFMHKRLQYRHTENITLFFDLLESLHIPQLFLFDMTDLYEKRNLPKVIYCIHAVSHFIAESEFALSAVDNLVGKLKFSDDQISATERGLAGSAMPNFGAMTRKLSGKQPNIDLLSDNDHEFDDLDDPSKPINWSNAYDDEVSDDGNDSDIYIKPPRRNHTRDDYGERVDSLMASTRVLSRDMYYENFSKNHRRRGRDYSYRNFSSSGSLRSRVLTSAERMLMELEDLEPEIIDFQAVCRGVLTRDDLFGRRHKYSKKSRTYLSRRQTESLVQLQSVARTALVRRKFLSSTLGTEKLKPFQALARGVLTRRYIQKLDVELRAKEVFKSLTYLQSAFRGNAHRYKLKCLFNDINKELANLVTLQACARGALVRRGKTGAATSWSLNLDKIVLIQSVWRAKTQGSRYRSLIAGSNPSLEAIKPFLHLIDDKPEDNSLQLELESMMREISKKAKHNIQLEASIEKLDMKIALLVKNDISIDEMVLQQQKQNELTYGKSDQESFFDKKRGSDKFAKGIATTTSGLHEKFDMNALSKSSRDRFELYQGLYYILQTQPDYLSKLMAHKAPRSLDMADLVFAVFQNGETPRERFFLLRLLAQSITQSTVGSPQNTISWCIVGYLNLEKEATETAKKILTPGTEKIKALLDHLLEYDPHIIYDHLNGGGDLSAEEAIQNPAVRTIFVQNLQRLREITMSIVQSLAQNVHNLPYHIKFMAREVHREVLKVTDDHNEAVKAIGQVVISQYLQPALLNADALNLVDAAAGNTSKNLALVSRVLHQVGLMTAFSAASGTDIYLQPLNEFIKSSSHQLSISFQKSIVKCPDLQTHFELNPLDDITLHERPLLHITMDSIMSLHYMCYNNLKSIASDNDVILKPVMERLGPLPRDAREMLDLARFKEVKLELNPKFCSAALNEEENGISSLLATTKRCLGYVLQVQNHQPDLMSVLVAPVELEDEHKYMLLLDTDNTREAAGDLGNLTFRELKLLTLEKVLELESSGSVSRQDGYQTLVNAIADDIRNKDVVRQKMQTNINSKRRTLQGLEEKGKFLQTRVDLYNKSINEAMTTLQSEAAEHLNVSKGKRFQRFQLPSAKQNNADMQNAQFGSYKSTAEKLYEKGILMRIKDYNERQQKDVHFNFSCNEVGTFQIDVSYKNIILPGGSITITLDDMLALQYENQAYVDLMGGDLQFSTNRLLKLILSKFLGSSSY